MSPTSNHRNDGEESPTSEIWLRDLVRAIERTNVGSDADAMAWAIELLGLDPEVFARATARPVAGGPKRPESNDGIHAPQRAADADNGPKVATGKRANRVIPHEVSRPQSAPQVQGGMPAWYVDAPAIAAAKPSHLDARPPLRPLFHPGTTRALLSTALATPSGEGEIDLGRVIDAIARRRPIRTLPRRRLASMRLGLQVLVDCGEGMRPFAADRHLLLDEIRAVVGRDRTELLYFADTPLRRVDRGDRYGRRFAYALPPAGTPVVLLTDLGLAGRGSVHFGASTDEWLTFARLVRRGECPLLALTPYGRTRWPRQLERVMHILPWDRSTSVSVVRQTVGHGLEAKRVP